MVLGFFKLIMKINFKKPNFKKFNFFKKTKYNTWKVGDLVLLKKKRKNKDVWNLLRGSHPAGIPYALLIKWDLDKCCIESPSGSQYIVKTKTIINFADKNRNSLDSMDRFVDSVGGAIDVPLINKERLIPSEEKLIFNGVHIQDMGEVELQSVLKQVVKDEDYETAAIIREELKKFD